MLRTILITAAILCAAPAAFAQELTAAQRDACMGDFEKYCKGTVPGGGRIIACLNKSGRQAHPGLQEGAGRRREEVDLHPQNFRCSTSNKAGRTTCAHFCSLPPLPSPLPQR